MQAVTAPFWWVFLRLIGFGLGILLLLLIVVAGCNIILAFAGDPGVCDSAGRPINVSDANAAAFKAKWDGFDASLDAGQAASVSLNESEITSRARQYLIEEKDTPVKDIVVCIRDGYGEASGALETPFGLDADVKVKGTMDLSGQHPRAVIDDIKIGGIPDFLMGPVESWLEDLIANQLDDINLKHTYAPTLTEGEAKVDGQPGPPGP